MFRWADEDLYWMGNDAAMDLHVNASQFRLAMVRPRGDRFRVIVTGTYKRVPIFLEYETQEKAMEAAVGFVKLLKEN